MHALLQPVIFYIFAGFAVLSALMVITQNNPVRCVLWLVMTFFASSVLWILMHSEFLALILVLVYVGAVMTLFLFVVMMLNIDIETQKTNVLKYMPFGVMLIAILVGLLLVSLSSAPFVANTSNVLKTTGLSNTEAIGMVLYTDYVWALELAAIILLVAIIATISLVHRETSSSKRQNILQQIMVRPEDRLSMHSLKDEKMLGEQP